MRSVFFLSGSKIMTGPFALCHLRQIEGSRKSGGCCKKKPQMEGKKREPSDKVWETALWLFFFCSIDDLQRNIIQRCVIAGLHFSFFSCTFCTTQSLIIFFSIILSQWFNLLAVLLLVCSHTQKQPPWSFTFRSPGLQIVPWTISPCVFYSLPRCFFHLTFPCQETLEEKPRKQL